MGISSAPEDGNWNDDLLLQTSETVLQMAQIARVSEVNEEMKVFYSHLGFHCVRLRHHARCARQSMFQLNGELVNQALDHLGSLVPESALQECKSYSARFRLGALNLHWSEKQKQPSEAKLDFIRQWLRPVISEEQRAEVDRNLERCADELDKQQPKQSYEKSVDDFAHLEIGEPTYAVGKASQSIFDALLDCKGCSCPGQHDFGAKLGLGTYRKPEKKIDKKPPRKSIRGRLQNPRAGDDAVASGLNFNLFLTMERDWHEVRIQTATEKAVPFNLPGEATPSPRESSAADDRHAKVDRLCRPMTKTKGRDLQRLVLKLTSGQLFDMGFEKSSFWIDKNTTPISLSQCFKERHEFFTEKTKRILSLIISYTVLYLNGTSWLQPGWGSANIKFFQTISRKTPLRPFIQAQLSKASAIPDFGLVVNTGGGDDDTPNELDSVHRCPALVALAVVLIEVYFVTPFTKLAQMHDIPLNQDPAAASLS